MPTIMGEIGTGQTFVWASLSLGREICGRKETRPKDRQEDSSTFLLLESACAVESELQNVKCSTQPMFQQKSSLESERAEVKRLMKCGLSKYTTNLYMDGSVILLH